MVALARIATPLLAALIATGALSAPVAADPLGPGAPLPALDLPGAGAALPPTSGKVVIVDFWASWCAPCRASFAVYSELQRDLGPSGLVVIGVGVDEDARAYAGFVAKLRPSFTTVQDPEHALVSRVQVPTMPTCYLVDRSGRVRFVHRGFHGADTERELRSEVRALLLEKGTSQ